MPDSDVYKRQHNVPGIVGMGAATALAVQNMEENAKKQIEVRDYLISRIEKEDVYKRQYLHCVLTYTSVSTLEKETKKIKKDK